MLNAQKPNKTTTMDSSSIKLSKEIGIVFFFQFQANGNDRISNIT